MGKCTEETVKAVMEEAAIINIPSKYNLEK